MGQEDRHPLSPRLGHCPAGLPRSAYLDAGWLEREMASIFARHWIMVGRASDFTPGRMRRVVVGNAPVIVARTADGGIAAYHNSCPHRGSELCRAEVEEIGRLIRCPYHAFAYAAEDGRLVATGHARPTADFDRTAHGLRAVAHQVWNGFLFLSLSTNPPPLHADVPLSTLDNWPMASLVTGHRWQADIECNWKTFWENYSECLHCPGIHPELCDMVPVYARGIMGVTEAHDWQPDHPAQPNLRPGAQTWTADGTLCAPPFPGLSDAERAAGYTFVTLWPTAYVVAHADYVRSVRIEPLAPERTRLTAEWHFAPKALPELDPAAVAAFAITVLEQDGHAAEMNQRGMRSPAFTAARLMPEEYEIHNFHRWILSEMEDRP